MSHSGSWLGHSNKCEHSAKVLFGSTDELCEVIMIKRIKALLSYYRWTRTQYIIGRRVAMRDARKQCRLRGI